MAKKPQFKDEANVKAAAQEAEERKLKRKQAFHKADGSSESRGVSFDDAESEEAETEEAPTDPEEDSTDPALTALSDDGILDSKEPKRTVLPESTGKGKQRTIKIVSDGTYENTTVYIGTKKLDNPDISITVSRNLGVRVVYIKQESLF